MKYTSIINISDSKTNHKSISYTIAIGFREMIQVWMDLENKLEITVCC